MSMKALRTIFGVASLALTTGCPQGGAPLKIDKLEPPQGTTAELWGALGEPAISPV